MQIFIHCKATLHVSDVTTPIIRSIKNCTRSLRYRSYYLYRYSPPTWSDRDAVFSMELASNTRNYEVAPRLNLCTAEYRVARRGVWEYYWFCSAGFCCGGCVFPSFCTAREGGEVGNYMSEYELPRPRRLCSSLLHINLIAGRLTRAATDPNATNVLWRGDEHWRQKAVRWSCVSAWEVAAILNVFIHMRFSKERSAGRKQRGVNSPSVGVERTLLLDIVGSYLGLRDLLPWLYCPAFYFIHVKETCCLVDFRLAPLASSGALRSKEW